MTIKFTDEEVKRILVAARSTWEYIGSDCLNAAAEYDGKNYMTRDEVIEVVIDAGRLEDEIGGRHTGRGKDPILATKLRNALDEKGGYSRVCKLLEPAFCKREGF